MNKSNLYNSLTEIIASSDEFMNILKAVRELRLNDWYVGAGAVRGLVWDHLHCFEKKTELKDIDIVYFDKDLTEREEQIQERLMLLSPNINWEVTNQALVHTWYENKFKITVSPLNSCEEGIATWPETATCVGVRLLENNEIHICAPYGLEDLFNMVLRWNPKRVTKEIFYNRIKEKNCARSGQRL